MTQIVTALGEIAAFKVGDVVRVAVRAPIGHYRVPTYLRGKRGVVARVLQPTAVDNEVEGFGQNAILTEPRHEHVSAVKLQLALMTPVRPQAIMPGVSRYLRVPVNGFQRRMPMQGDHLRS